MRGESPCCATVNSAPFDPYATLPVGVKRLEAPEVKSTSIDFPSAGSAGQLPSFCQLLGPAGNRKNTHLVLRDYMMCMFERV